MPKKIEPALGFVLASKHRRKMMRLLKKKPRRQKDLAKALNLADSNASTLVSSLQKKGLLNNISGQERWKVLSLTQKGRRIHSRLRSFF